VCARVEAISATGEVLAARSVDVLSWDEPGASMFVDVLGQLGVSALSDGMVRVTRESGSQLLWGVLSNVYDDGRLSVVAPSFP